MSDHPKPLIIGYDYGEVNEWIEMRRRQFDDWGHYNSMSRNSDAGIYGLPICEIHLIKGWAKVVTPELATWLLKSAEETICPEESHRGWAKEFLERDWMWVDEYPRT